MGELAELLLMAAARVQHVDRVIRPAIAAGRIVVTDRFVGSTIAYQGGGRGLPLSNILALHRLTVGDFKPSLTVILDVDPEVGLLRSRSRLATSGDNEGRFERLDTAFHNRVRASYLAQAAEAPKLSCGRGCCSASPTGRFNRIGAARRVASDTQRPVIGYVLPRKMDDEQACSYSGRTIRCGTSRWRREADRISQAPTYIGPWGWYSRHGPAGECLLVSNCRLVLQRFYRPASDVPCGPRVSSVARSR